MEIRQIEYFVEVAKQLSFTKAAATLHVSQPSISKAIQNLEAELGVPLFYRSSKHLELTDAGHSVLINAHQVLQSFKNLRSELTDLMDLKKGQIRIGIPPIVGAEFFSKLISYYKEQYPFIEIILTEAGTKLIRHEIESGELDIGLVCSSQSKNDQLNTISFMKDPLQLIVHVDHPLAKKSSVLLQELMHEPFIIYRKDFVLYDRIIEECSKVGFTPTIACETTQKDLIIEMVQAKLGVALLPNKIATKIPYDCIQVIDVSSTPIHLELGITWKKNKYLSFAVREFIEAAKQFQLN
ncbi:MAG: LysR family transcriptional regulator [Lysinibacillus sp.]